MPPPCLILPPLLADVAVPETAVFAWDTPAGFVTLFLLVVVVETVLLRLLRWGGWKHAFVCSLVINTVSTILGFVVMIPGVRLFYSLPPVLWLLACFVLTVLSEGIVLRWMQRGVSWKRAFMVSLLINLGSYVLLTAIVILTPRPVRHDRPYPRPQPYPTPAVEIPPSPEPSATP